MRCKGCGAEGPEMPGAAAYMCKECAAAGKKFRPSCEHVWVTYSSSKGDYCRCRLCAAVVTEKPATDGVWAIEEQWADVGAKFGYVRRAGEQP